MLHQTPNFSAMTIVSLGGAYILGIVLMVLIYALYEPAGVYAALEANTGTRVTFRKAWAVSWSKAGRYVWLAILRAVIVMLPILVFGALIVGTFGLSMARGRGGMDPSLMMVIFPLFMLLYLAWMVYTVLIMLRLVLAVPASVAEDLSAWRSLRRSNQLTSGAKGRIFLLGLLIYAIAYGAFLVVEVIVFFLAAIAALVGDDDASGHGSLGVHWDRRRGDCVRVRLPGLDCRCRVGLLHLVCGGVPRSAAAAGRRRRSGAGRLRQRDCEIGRSVNPFAPAPHLRK
jgi:hypothetical protein